MARSTGAAPTSPSANKRSAQPKAGERRTDEDASALASYIADMAAELSQLAGRSEMPMVCYFLNLARVEAELHAREFGGGPIERSK